MNKIFRAGFLINSNHELPAWEIEMLRNLQHSGLTTINVFIIAEENSKEKKGWGLQFFQKFENWWFRSMPDAFKISALPNEFGAVQIIGLNEKEKIVAMNLDIIYRSCLVTGSPSLAACASYGEWFITWGTGKYSGELPVAFREVMDDIPEIGSSLLVQLVNSDEPITIYMGTTTTVPYSVKNSLNSIAWKSSSFLQYRITELSQLGPALFFSKYKTNTGIHNKANISFSKPPSSLTLSALFIRNISRYLFNKLSRLFKKDRFTLLFAQQEFSIPDIDFSNFTSLKLPKDTFRADPFIIEKEGKFYIFFEEFLYTKNKAHICVLELSKDGQYSKPEIILDRPYHLSYPFLFESEGIFYMIPETSANRTVELYKCIEFPLKWEFVENLMENIILIDPTLLYHQEKWWLFGTSQIHPFTSTNDQLFLYYSETLLSAKWKPHPQNPVATTISNCRPAGAIFKLNGKLYRPAQNNASKQYGYGIKINEIEILTETEYKEKEVFEILPDEHNKLKAIHTINFVNNMIVIDGIPS